MEDRRIKIGVVGTGGIFEGWEGGNGHLPSYPWVIDEAKVTSLCDVNRENLKRAEKSFKKLYYEKAKLFEEKGDEEICELLEKDILELKIYTNIDEMFEKEKIDLIDILTPPNTHLNIIKKSLNNGYHVMCEKPLARTWIEAQEIVEEVNKSGKFFQYNENLIFSDPYYDIRGLIQSGEIGEIEAIWFPYSIGGMGNCSYLKSNIGSMLDMAIHGITLCWFLIGFDFSPKRVKTISPGGISIRIRNRLIDGIFKNMDVEDYSHFVVEFENNSTAQWVNIYIEGSWSFQNMCCFKVVGSKGEITIKNERIEIKDVFGNCHFIDPFHAGFLNINQPPGYTGFPQEILAMVRYIKENIKPYCDERIASESLLIAQAAYLSEANGRKGVVIDEFKEYSKKFKKNSDALLKELLEKGITR